MPTASGQTTPLDIIRMALKDCGKLGVGQPPLAEDVNDAYQKVQWMLSEWQRRRWLIWHLVNTGFTADGSQSFTVGPGGKYPISPRPDKIESAFMRQVIPSFPNQVDYPLEILQTWEDYSRLGFKQLISFPQAVFYDPGWPVGTLHVWPVPSAGLYSVFIQTKEILSQFTSLNEAINLPPEYYSAIHWNLAYRLAPGYGLEPSDVVKRMAKNSLNVIRMANTAIGRLSMPKQLVRPNPFPFGFAGGGGGGPQGPQWDEGIWDGNAQWQ